MYSFEKKDIPVNVCITGMTEILKHTRNEGVFFLEPSAMLEILTHTKMDLNNCTKIDAHFTFAFL